MRPLARIGTPYARTGERDLAGRLTRQTELASELLAAEQPDSPFWDQRCEAAQAWFQQLADDCLSDWTFGQLKALFASEPPASFDALTWMQLTYAWRRMAALLVKARPAGAGPVTAAELWAAYWRIPGRERQPEAA
jgi:hypothetical protein